MRSASSAISGRRDLKFVCRTGFAGRAPAEDYPLSNRVDEVDTLLIFDDVLIPWENVLFYRHTKAAVFIRATLHRYSAFAFVQRNLKLADMMIGAALFNVRQTGLDKQQAVQEKLAQLAVYREGINAHLTASIALCQRSPGGLMMPNQSLLYTGRVLACSQLHEMMHIARELCGGQICVTPDKAAFEAVETKPWMEKFYSINEDWVAEDRRKLLAFARDLLNSDYAGHRLTFQLFAQSPPFRASRRRLPELRLGRAARFRAEVGRAIRARAWRRGGGKIARQRGAAVVREPSAAQDRRRIALRRRPQWTLSELGPSCGSASCPA